VPKKHAWTSQSEADRGAVSKLQKRLCTHTGTGTGSSLDERTAGGGARGKRKKKKMTVCPLLTVIIEGSSEPVSVVQL